MTHLSYFWNDFELFMIYFFMFLQKAVLFIYILFLFNFCVDSKQSFWSGTDSTKSSFGPTTELTAPQRICLYLIKKG